MELEIQFPGLCQGDPANHGAGPQAVVFPSLEIFQKGETEGPFADASPACICPPAPYKVQCPSGHLKGTGKDKPPCYQEEPGSLSLCGHWAARQSLLETSYLEAPRCWLWQGVLIRRKSGRHVGIQLSLAGNLQIGQNGGKRTQNFQGRREKTSQENGQIRTPAIARGSTRELQRHPAWGPWLPAPSAPVWPQTALPPL